MGIRAKKKFFYEISEDNVDCLYATKSNKIILNEIFTLVIII